MLSRRDLLSSSVLAGLALGSGLVADGLQAQNAPTGSGFDVKRANADYYATGLPMWPFRVKVVNGTTLLKDVGFFPAVQCSWWRVQGHTSVSGGNAYTFMPLGDTVSVQAGGLNSTAALLLAPDPTAPDALKHPVAFRWVEDDFDGHGDARYAYMDLVPPPGYTALGQAWQVKGQEFGPADLNRYWCVKNEHLRNLSQLNTLWSDRGFGWSHNGDVRTPGFAPTDVFPRDAVYMLPLTMIGAESPLQPKAIRMQRPILTALATDSGKDAVFVPTTRSGATFSPGIAQIVAMPCVAFTDAAITNQAQTSPVYYVVDRPIWKCIQSDATPQGGTKTYQKVIGVSTTDSVEFNHTTSSTVSAEGGFDIKGISAKVSTSFTETFSLTTGHTQNNSTEFTDSITVTLPPAPVTQFWQLFSEIGIYRMDGSLLKKVVYGRSDYRLLSSTTPQVS